MEHTARLYGRVCILIKSDEIKRFEIVMYIMYAMH